MSNLSADQLKQIEKNRTMAILKRKKTQSGVINNNSSNLQKSNNCHSNDKFISVKNLQFSNSKHSQSSLANHNVSAVCRLVSESQFIVDMPFHAASIEIFKTIPGKSYDPSTKKWKFPLSSYEILINKLKKEVAVTEISQKILNTFRNPDTSLEANKIDLSKIDPVLLSNVFPFQEEGIRFGIAKKGRCMIADDMGLGKTIQALGIAHYYKENWPLLIVCPSSMKFPWEEAIQIHLPSVNPFYIVVMTTGKDLINEAHIVICSYDLMKSCLSEFLKKNFGVIILDESHSLKSLKTARTKAALQLVSKCKNVILLSGTPALSRPEELYPQISAIDPLFFHSFHDFGIRYCDGKLEKYGWNFSGSSNLEELELLLKKRIMIRRMKSEVITQLPSKIRKAIVLDPTTVKGITKQMKKLAFDFENKKGNDKRSTLLTYYALTGSAKLNAVCEYLGQKLENESKFLVFAHHLKVIDEISLFIKSKNIDYIRIDGSTNSELRKNLCDKFQSNENCRVAVLSITAANTGITLTAAQLVIFAELYWNPGILTQAEDRAHRIGQSDSVIIEYLVAKGTADDHLWNLVQLKLNVLGKAGLTKDNFKEVDTEHLERSHQKQQKLDWLLESKKTDENSDQIIQTDVKQGDSFDECIFDDGLEDDVFANIKLDEIEKQYCLESKKRRTDL